MDTGHSGKIFCIDLNEFRLDFAKKFETVTINSGNIIQPINIQKAWCEIDTPEDIPRAKKILV